MIKTYTDEFKKKISGLVVSGRAISELAREYGIAKSTISVWNRQYKNSGSFKKSDNLTDEEKELIALRKENKHLKMEVDILKQTTLILGTKRQIICENANKYSISAMCKVLKIPKSSYYYKKKASI